MNPIGNVFCSQCNTRLLPAEMQLPEKPKPAEESPVGVKGISLPTLPKAKDGGLEPEELPDWLLELTEQSLGKPTETAEVAESAAADQFPDWLSDLADTTDQGGGETPDAFAEGESTTESAPALSELPDWFTDLTGDASAAEEPAPEEADTGATPDWLAGLLEEEETAGSFEVETEPAMAEEPVLEGLPDWLSDMTPEEPAAGPVEDIYEVAPPASTWEAAVATPDIAAQPAAELPDWLLASAEPASPGEAPAQSVPQWLLKNVEEPVPGQEAGETPGAGQIPAWLMQGAEPGAVAVAPRAPAPSYPEPAKIQERARPAAETAPAPVPVVEPKEPAPGAGEPDWLMDILEEEGEPQAVAAFEEPVADAAPEEATPDWLLSIYGEEEAQPQAAVLTTEPEETAAETGIPDWLAAVYSEEEAEPQADSSAAEAEKAAPGVPDWLAGIYNEEEAEPLATVFSAEPEEEIAPETAVPDWLAGIIAEEPVPVEPQASPEDEETALEMGVPDWLAGLEPEAPTAEEERPAPSAADSAIFTAAAPEEAQAGPSTTPEWLKGMTPVDEEMVLKPAQPAFIPGEGIPDASEEEYDEPVLAGGEIPDWLKGLSPATSSPVEEEAAFYERVSEDESLVRAEVPSWLQGLRPPGTGPLPPLPEVMVPGAEIPLPQEGGLVRAEIPDWVQQLRPVPSAEGEAGERVLEPAETEGPLAGLRGVLPAGLAVDMPADFQPTLPLAFPDAIAAQAQLWQKLLEQPRSVQRPVAQFHARSGRGQMATRLIVTAILLAVTMLGLLWGGAPHSQALSRPHIEHLSKAIDTLEAGDTVIVAVEYGPAEAGEMATIAQTVMQHLADRNAHAMMVSTLPEGAGLIQSLLEPLALANRLPAGQTAYLPGSASGVAQFLTVPSEAKMIVVLAGRGERLRWWVEQNNATQALPMVVGVNAVTAPLAMPYLETPPVAGWMAGLPDVAAYQEFRGLSSGVLKSQLDTLMLAHWAALVLLLFGLIYYLALGKKGAS